MISADLDREAARRGVEVFGPSNASWSRIYGWSMDGLWLMTVVYRNGAIVSRVESSCSLVVREETASL